MIPGTTLQTPKIKLPKESEVSYFTQKINYEVSKSILAEEAKIKFFKQRNEPNLNDYPQENQDTDLKIRELKTIL